MQHFLADLTPATLLLLVGALAMAFFFEAINGFHDTANAVATVIYTNTLRPWWAVIWSGIWNFIGVVVSTGAVAFGIVALLPVELVTHSGSAAGLGLPVSTTHILSSGVAGTMAANNSGLQMRTLRNIVLAWVLTVPVTVFLGAALFAAGSYVVLRVFGA